MREEERERRRAREAERRDGGMEEGGDICMTVVCFMIHVINTFQYGTYVVSTSKWYSKKL